MSAYYRTVTNWWCARSRRVAAFKTLGSLYDGANDELEERAIRTQLRRMGIPIDPVLSDVPQALEETYWEPDGPEGVARRQRDYRVAHNSKRYRRRV